MTHLYPALDGGSGNFCINGGLFSTTDSPSSSEAALSMSRICEVLRKHKVDVGDESSLRFPSLLVEFLERPLDPFRLSPPEELCRKTMVHRLDDDSGHGLELSTVAESEVYTY